MNIQGRLEHLLHSVISAKVQLQFPPWPSVALVRDAKPAKIRQSAYQRPGHHALTTGDLILACPKKAVTPLVDLLEDPVWYLELHST
jgi:hypothetical protein